MGSFPFQRRSDAQCEAVAPANVPAGGRDPVPQWAERPAAGQESARFSAGTIAGAAGKERLLRYRNVDQLDKDCLSVRDQNWYSWSGQFSTRVEKRPGFWGKAGPCGGCRVNLPQGGVNHADFAFREVCTGCSRLVSGILTGPIRLMPQDWQRLTRARPRQQAASEQD